MARGGELARADSGHLDGAAADDVLAALFRAHGLGLVRMALLQIEVKAKPSLSPPPPKLASLDLTTGKVTYLPNGWLGRMLMSVIRW